MKVFYIQKPFFAVFMTIYLVLAGFLALPALMQAYGMSFYPSLPDLVRGTWTKTYEKNFAEKLLPYDFALELWGSGELALFHEGRHGVLIGEHGWLFSAEEFKYVRDSEQNIEKNMDYIRSIKRQLLATDTKMIVVLVPSKARTQHEYLGRYTLPESRAHVYERAISELILRDIKVANLLELERMNNAFLKTDTHWSSEGAAASARITAKTIVRTWPGLKFPHINFQRIDTKEEAHEGDLVHYIPAGNMLEHYNIKPETLRVPVFAAKDETAQDLFSDSRLTTVLVGTSYSANPLWGFEAALKEELQTDILNISNEAIGPFESMRNYLASEDYKVTKPKLVIWEIPERYLPLP